MSSEVFFVFIKSLIQVHQERVVGRNGLSVDQTQRLSAVETILNQYSVLD